MQHEDEDLNFVVHVGVGWEFPIGEGFTLAPELAYVLDFDQTKDNAVTFGLIFGVEF